MPNQNRTLIALVLDRSGSMMSIRDATISSVNKFLDDQRRQPGDLLVTMIQFSTDYEFTHKNVAGHLVPPLTAGDYKPAGYTALLDAIGRTVDETGYRLAAMPEAERPAKVVIVIVTDGYENSSEEYTYKQVHHMITHQRDKYGWQFVFLAANIDAAVEARKIGIGGAQAMSFAAGAVGVRNSYEAVSSNVSSYRSGHAQSVSFNESDRTAAMDTGKKGTP